MSKRTPKNPKNWHNTPVVLCWPKIFLRNNRQWISFVPKGGTPYRNHHACSEKLWFVTSLYPNLPQMGQNFYHGMLMPLHDSMPSFMNFRQVLDLVEFKNQASQRFAGNQQCPGVWISFQSLAWYLAIHPRTQCDFSTNFGALEHVVVVKIWNMHIKRLENPVNV